MNIIIKPVLTEKANSLMESKNRYGFFVQIKANKIEIAKEISAHYGVKVEKVWTQRCPIQTKTKHTKKGLLTGRSILLKKAFVQVKEGESIDFFTNV